MCRKVYSLLQSTHTHRLFGVWGRAAGGGRRSFGTERENEREAGRKGERQRMG